MEEKSDNSSLNTVLLVIVLLLVVGFGVWWFATQYQAPAPASDNGGLNIDVKLPNGTGTRP